LGEPLHGALRRSRRAIRSITFALRRKRLALRWFRYYPSRKSHLWCELLRSGYRRFAAFVTRNSYFGNEHTNYEHTNYEHTNYELLTLTSLAFLLRCKAFFGAAAITYLLAVVAFAAIKPTRKIGCAHFVGGYYVFASGGFLCRVASSGFIAFVASRKVKPESNN
jgi:hypothetical protein